MRKNSRPAVLFVLLLLAAAPTLAYTVVMKDGATLIAREKYEVQGRNAVVTLMSGTQTTIPLSEIDVERTDEMNIGADLGSALVVSGRGVERLRAASSTDASDRSLSDLIRERRAREGDEAKPEETTTDAPKVPVPKTAAGFEDFSRMRRRPVVSEDLQRDLTDLLVKAGVSLFKVYAGTRQNHVLIELTTDDEKQVLSALTDLSKVTLNLRKYHRQVEALEVLMVTRSGSRAGQFVLTGKNAPLLANERMSPGDFFLEYVQF